MSESGWNAKEYKKIQRRYQNLNGIKLIDDFEKLFSLNNKCVLDIGSGDGYLTEHLRTRVGNDGFVVGMDGDKNMFRISKKLEEKYTNLKIIHGNAIKDINKIGKNFDIVFSNAVIHWFETYENLTKFIENVYNILSKEGKILFRFSLDKHGEKAKQFLQMKINEFYNSEDIEIQKSNYDYISS